MANPALSETQIRRLQLKAAKSRAWEEAFKAKVASGQWERECAEERGRPAIGVGRATCAEK